MPCPPEPPRPPIEAQVERANAGGRVPIVFLPGLWLLPGSWDRWAAVFGEAGFPAVLPTWPADPPPTPSAAGHAGSAPWTVGEVAGHVAGVIGRLERKPVVVGHSFGGLLAQILAGDGLAAATVAIAPAPERGVLPLPISPPRAPARPGGAGRAVPLTYDQFRHSFANAAGEEEARRLHERYAVPAPGAPPPRTAALDPWNDTEVDAAAPARGPLLLISGELDRTAPWPVTRAAYERQARNAHHRTEIAELPGRGHSLIVDGGWREVCGTALTFIQRYVCP
ncbi:alpha/beta hydrolase [Actinomadura sp. ATCC 31491]|uniref:Alpha/beta hydrolase n=1 Tax=Actinomadura luzonensis TaxID=2805427 RepID=A0ABT0FYI0_9ACTN|nr:alpha/beta hydrolase [Actinomadura luzonensis]MCK2216943.1 alpha/beta hydrolase [Actinomadura luzonensis]